VARAHPRPAEAPVMRAIRDVDVMSPSSNFKFT